jgi:hypothetical protein
MYRNKSFASQTLTDAGTVTLNPAHDVESNFEGSIIFAAKGTKATGTFSASAQLQGSLDGTNWVNLGSAVVMSDATWAAIPLTGNTLYYNAYRVVITGSGTQSTAIVGAYTAKGRR